MNIHMRFPGGRSRCLTLSYDDGVRADIRLAEVCNRHGMKCTFNINSGLFSVGSRLPVETIKEKYVNSPHEIAVHGYKHLAPSALQAPALIMEFLEDRKNLCISGVSNVGSFDEGIIKFQEFNQVTLAIIHKSCILMKKLTEGFKNFCSSKNLIDLTS